MPSPPPHRKRMRRIETPGEARYLTFSCYQRLPLFKNDAIKKVFAERLIALRKERNFQLIAWVLMPEHAHLLILPDPQGDPVDDLLASLKRPIAERVLRRWKTLNAPILSRIRDAKGHLHFWQVGGGYDQNLFSPPKIEAKIDYTHANPIRRGIVKIAEEYPWSSARWYGGRRDGEVPIDPLIF